MISKINLPKRKPSSVGTILKKYFLEPHRITHGQLAKAMGVSRRVVNQICRDKMAVTGMEAALLSRVLGTTPEFWLNLQLIRNAWILSHDHSLHDQTNHTTPLAGFD